MSNTSLTSPASSSWTPVAASPAPEVMRLDALSERLQLSQQTLVRWVDRHLIDASLTWALDGDNEEVRMIELPPETLDHLEAFAGEYRQDAVNCRQARRILKIIDRKWVKKMIRAENIEAVEVEGETRVVVGSLEDYLMSQEETR